MLSEAVARATSPGLTTSVRRARKDAAATPSMPLLGGSFPKAGRKIQSFAPDGSSLSSTMRARPSRRMSRARR